MSKIFGSLMKTVYSVGNIPIDIKQRRLDPIKAQTKELKKLLKKASETAFGERYHFEDILKSDDILNTYRENVPIFDYNSMYKNWWFRALNGEAYVSWPGKVKYFALSSGTSEASSKFIPITNNMLSSIKKASLRQILAATKYDFPIDFYNKGFLMIGGSTHLQYNGTYYSGDLSGISAAKLPFWFEYFYKPGRKISKTTDWNTKLDEMVKKAPSWDIGVLVGVPSWVQILLERIIKEYNLNTIHDLWPSLSAYVHSGVAFAPYEKSFEKLFGKHVVYSESYLASEGYIAYQVDLNKRIMQLIVDNGIYYEFVPFNENNFDEDGNIRPNCKSLTLSEVEEDVDYALLLSTNAGSWRYLIGDMIKFVNKERCEIIITGRTKQFLSLVGEHLSQDNMNQAIENISNDLKVTINEFTVAGFREDKYFAHHWYLGCDEPIDKEVAIRKIDEHLKVLNDDYRVEREEALSNLYIDILPTHVFYDFMEKTGKIGGATKFPRVLKGNRYEEWKKYISSINIDK
ncbi:MAG: GH3 auxin-responsive promoter family protein [Bacteroidales bacterium]|nr:GH3 auxin-responsive promoter family protein [Bacteroidales bacterium]